MEKYGAGSIVVSDYDPNWPTLFEQECTRIKNALGSFALVIEHVGSTAVPGLPSKPIIDLLVGVPSLEEAKERCMIEAVGYNYIREYASWLPGELFFRKGTVDPPCACDGAILSSLGSTSGVSRLPSRTHRGSAPISSGHLLPLAASSKDNIEAYRNGKNTFVEETTAKARAWRADAGA
jgi:GrpB-like predicted nucleotidyltransferase (UPF0157 family)